MSHVTELVGDATTEPDAKTPTTRATIVELFRQQVRSLGPRSALRHSVDGSWQPITWAEYGDAVREIASRIDRHRRRGREIGSRCCRRTGPSGTSPISAS